MKSYKFLLLSTVVAATILPFSLTAITSDEDDGRSHYVPHAHVKVAPPAVEEKGWFSSFRSSFSQKAESLKASISQKVEELKPRVVKGFKTLGRDLQKEEMGSAHGQFKQMAAKATVSCFLPTALQNFAGDLARSGLQTLGNVCIKIHHALGGKKTRTDLKLEELKSLQGEAKFKAAAQNLSFEAFEKVVTRLVETGQVSKKQMEEIDAKQIYIDTLAASQPSVTFESLTAMVKAQRIQASQQDIQGAVNRAQLLHDADSNWQPVNVLADKK